MMCMHKFTSASVNEKVEDLQGMNTENKTAICHQDSENKESCMFFRIHVLLIEHLLNTHSRNCTFYLLVLECKCKWIIKRGQDLSFIRNWERDQFALRQSCTCTHNVTQVYSWSTKHVRMIQSLQHSPLIVMHSFIWWK